tara:strand:+ start:17 stop:217 length:201 start_codon:yes stop_codon:yes gene_type:complete
MNSENVLSKKRCKDARQNDLVPLFADDSELPIALVSKSASQHTKNIILAIWKKECNDGLSTELIQP